MNGSGNPCIGQRDGKKDADNGVLILLKLGVIRLWLSLVEAWILRFFKKLSIIDKIN